MNWILKSKIDFKNILQYVPHLVALGISVKLFVPILITIFMLYSIWCFREFKISLNKNIIFISFPFLLAITGFFYSENISKALEDISIVLPFLIFPLIFSGLHLKDKKPILKAFQIGIVLRLIFDLLRTTFINFSDLDFSHFTYTNLDADTNIFSVIIVFSILVESLRFYKRGELPSSLHFFFLVVSLFLLESRFAILTFFLLSFGLFSYFQLYKKWKLSLLLATFVFGSLVFFMQQSRSQRAIQEISSFQSTSSHFEKSQIITECMTPTSVRFNAAYCSIVLIINSPLIGYGTGDWLDVLVRKYKLENMVCNVKERTAPHNQFLRFGLKYGFIGVVFYLCTLFYLFRNCWKEISVKTILLSVIALSSFGYDILEVGSGAPTFAFLISLLFSEFNLATKATNQNN
jgi:O-antigen ligase